MLIGVDCLGTQSRVRSIYYLCLNIGQKEYLILLACTEIRRILYTVRKVPRFKMKRQMLHNPVRRVQIAHRMAKTKPYRADSALSERAGELMAALHTSLVCRAV